MPYTPHDSTGTTFAFGGTTFTVTSISYSINDNADQIDVSHLGQSAGSTVLTLARPLKGTPGDTGKEVSIDFLPSSGAPISQGVTGTLTIAGGITLSVTATCKSCQITLGVNDAARGTASFQVP